MLVKYEHFKYGNVFFFVVNGSQGPNFVNGPEKLIFFIPKKISLMSL